MGALPPPPCRRLPQDISVKEKGAAMQLVMISGCSGGGKSSLLDELARRGHHVVAEPGRRIVDAALAGQGGVLPWEDMAGFARVALDMAAADYRSARGVVFFDRGIVDAAMALHYATGAFGGIALARRMRYDMRVFMVPPWPEIFGQDEARRHGFDAALAEYRRLVRGYRTLGYRLVRLPRIGVGARADWLLARRNPGHRGPCP